MTNIGLDVCREMPARFLAKGIKDLYCSGKKSAKKLPDCGCRSKIVVTLKLFSPWHLKRT